MANRIRQAQVNRRARYGSLTRPARTSGDWGTDWATGPVPWSWDVQADEPVFWVGDSLGGGLRPIGPNGPWHGHTSIPTVERATGLIVGPLTAVWPWRVYRGAWYGSDAEPLGLPTWLRDPTLANRTPGVEAEQQWFLPWGWKKPAARFWAEVVRHALWFGRGWFMYQPAEDYTPISGTFLNISPTVVDVLPGGRVELDMGDWGTVTTRVDGTFDLAGATWRVGSIQEPLGDGTGVIGRHASLLNVGVNVQNYTSSTFRAGVPNGYLKVTREGLTPTQAQTLKEKWMAAHGDTRSIAVLNASTEFHPITFSPVDAALTDVDHMITRKVAHAFNLSAWALDAGSSGNDYANITDRRQDKVDDTLMPWKRAVEDALGALLPYGTWLELETRGYLQTNPETRMAYFKSGQEVGAFGPDYVQDMERIPTAYRPTQPQPEEGNE